MWADGGGGSKKKKILLDYSTKKCRNMLKTIYCTRAADKKVNIGSRLTLLLVFIAATAAAAVKHRLFTERLHRFLVGRIHR